jgi:SAM-dependent methyltransferase
MSTTYKVGHHESVLRSHRWRTVENSAAYLRPHLRSGMQLLDVGCGPGTITRELSELVGPTGRVVGIDAAAEVLEAAASALGRHAPEDQSNLHFEVGDVMALAFPNETFDVVHAHQVLQHLSDPVSALREMRRVTRPGGIIAVRDADYDAMTWFPQLVPLDAWLRTYQAVAQGGGLQPNAGRRLLSWAHEAGLSGITCSASVWCFATAEDRAWWGGLQADRILYSGVAKEAVAKGIATAEELTTMSQAWLTWADHDDAWFAVLHGEILVRVPQTSEVQP